MQQITFENWKQLDFKVGDPVLIQYPNGTEIHTTVQTIASWGSYDKQPIKFPQNFDGGDRYWIDFSTTYKYFKLTDNSSCFALIDYFDTDMDGYYYIPESNSIRSDNVSPSKILKHSTNQNGERVWKLRKTWVTDTQIKNALNPVAQEVPAKQWMIVGTEHGLQTIMTQTVFTELETLKQEMQTILLKNPLIKLTAVELTGIQISLDLSNPVFKWS